MIDMGVHGSMYRVSETGSLPCDTLNSVLRDDMNTVAPKLIAAINRKSSVRCSRYRFFLLEYFYLALRGEFPDSALDWITLDWHFRTAGWYSKNIYPFHLVLNHFWLFFPKHQGYTDSKKTHSCGCMNMGRLGSDTQNNHLATVTLLRLRIISAILTYAQKRYFKMQHKLYW